MRRERAERIISDLGLNRSDALIDVLVSDESSDVEACPGSGKTTSLGLKVAVELASWPHRYRGILILSHTNVARVEIERAAKDIPGCADILRRPHCVGTIQAFVDTFLAMPFLRGKGIQPKIIDDDIAAAYLTRGLESPQFRAARSWLDFSKNKVDKLEWGVDDDTITLDGEKLAIRPGTDSFRQLVALKHRSMVSGIFRYGDMYTFAERCLRDEPWIVEVLRYRFPLVMIDEMQDTSERQLALLEAVFPRIAVRVHRFGDANQAIFDSGLPAQDNPEAFPRSPILPLMKSQRFGNFIAGAVSGVSANGQAILGADGAEQGAPHAILLYTEESVLRVLSTFAEIVKSTARPGEHVRAHAIGFKKSPPAHRPGEIRANLATYLPSFQASAYETAYGTLAAHIAEARRIFSKRGLHEAMRSAKRGLRELFERWDMKNGSGMYVVLQSSIQDRAKSGALLLDLLLDPKLSPESWRERTESLCEVAEKAFGGPSKSDLRQYLGFDAALFERERSSNSARYEFSEQISVEVVVDTIHGVKGETHAATLVLETYYRSHDLEKMIPFISGRKKVTKKEPTDLRRLRAIYVAMSRPRNLVCLALQAAHLSPKDERILEEKGWRIVRL